MSNKKSQKTDNPNIGENTRWDRPMQNPTAGSTLPKPPTSLKPRDENPKK